MAARKSDNGEVGKTDAGVTEVMSERELAKAMGGEIISSTKEVSLYPQDAIGAVDSFAAALELAGQTHGLAEADKEPSLGDGFKVASEDDKRRLCGVLLLFMEWAFRESDFGSDQDWVSISAIQRGENGEAIKWIINDGSTGIAKDLQAYTEKTGKTGGLLVKHGLSESKYFIDGNRESENFGKALNKKTVREYMADGRGKHLAEASTFRLDTSA